MTESRHVPLSLERHRGRFWRRFRSYEFARHRRWVPLVLAEVEAVAAAMPVVFADAGAGPEPVALLRLVPGGASPFVSPAGLWLGTYVPSLVRVHPFAARPAGDGRMMLTVDEESGLVTDDPADEPFFDAEGGASPETAKLVDFFRQREASAALGRAAVARLQALELLVPFAPQIDAPADSWAGLQAIDRARIEALEDAAFLELRRLGAIGLVHAHLVSLAQIPWLMRAEAMRDAEPAGQPAATRPSAPTPDRGIDEFLASVAAAHDDAAVAYDDLLPAPAAPKRQDRETSH